ncbi:acyltransferase family protein [Micromonospora sp. CA-259024]|uniref:acyltransferase family protein n=1 Tax=Micromonospora sp. CA-259024 TaxID=3239965 RepID=UPI003D94194B
MTAAPQADLDRRGERLDSLTGLRWFAALAVFLAHVSTLLPLPSSGLDSALSLGSSGVTFFFVLSGFVLTWTWTARDRAGPFYGRRFARIWPLLAIGVLVPLALQLPQVPEPMRETMVWASISAILLYQAWVPDHILGGASPVTWSLAVEAFFYALFPFLAKPVLRRSLVWLAGAAVVLILIGWGLRVWLWEAYPPTPRPNMVGMEGLVLGVYSPIARLWEFLLGVVAAAAMRKGWRPRLSVSAAVAVLTAGLAVLWLLRDETFRVAVPFDVLPQVTAPLYALVVIAVASRDLSGHRSWLGSRPLVKLGEWSYAFYLLHFTVLFEIASRVYDKNTVLEFYRRPVEASWSNAGWALFALVATTGLCALLYQLYERPVELWLRARIGRQPKAGVR